MEINEKAENVQGTKIAKKQSISKTYTITQLGEMIRKLKELKWINEEEERALTKIREKVKIEFMKGL